MECPFCNETMENLGLGANPKGGVVSPIYSCMKCDKTFRPLKKNPPVIHLMDSLTPYSKAICGSKTGQQSDALEDVTCPECIRYTKAYGFPEWNPQEGKAKKKVKVKQAIQKVTKSKPVLKAKEILKSASAPAVKIATEAGKSAGVTGLRTAAGMLEGTISMESGPGGVPGQPVSGSVPASGFKAFGGHQYNIGPAKYVGQSNEMPLKGMFIPAHKEGDKYIEGRWIGEKDNGYIAPPDDFWPVPGSGSTPPEDGGGFGGSARSFLGLFSGLKDLSPETVTKLTKMVPTVALIEGAVDVLKGPGGQKLLESVGAGVGAGIAPLMVDVGKGTGDLLKQVGTGVGGLVGTEGIGRTFSGVGGGVHELLGKEGMGGAMTGSIKAARDLTGSEQVKTGVGKTVGSVGSAIESSSGAYGKLVGEGATGLVGSVGSTLSGPTDIAKQSIGGFTGLASKGLDLIGQKQQLEHQSRQSQPLLNPKEEDQEEFLLRLIKNNSTASSADDLKLQLMLKGLGFINAIVTHGKVHFDGEEKPSRIDSTATLVLNRIGLNRRASGGGKK